MDRARGWMDRVRGWAFGLAGLAFLPAAAMAQDAAAPAAKPVVEGLSDWQVYFQPAAAPIMHEIRNLNSWLQVILAAILLLVLALLGWCIIRFNARRHPVPSKTSHNSLIEVLWTVVPVLILVGIAIPSFSLLFAQYDPARAVADYDPDKALTIKATGNQWYWVYDYPDSGIELYSNPIPDGDDRLQTRPRLLAVDYPMVVPVNTVVRLQATADPSGVIHAFALPAFGMKIDAVPGRITEMWFQAEREGTYYGQCSELCGSNHYNMPIEIRVVSQDHYNQWVETAATDPDAGNDLLDTWEAERQASTQAGGARVAQN